MDRILGLMGRWVDGTGFEESGQLKGGYDSKVTVTLYRIALTDV